MSGWRQRLAGLRGRLPRNRQEYTAVAIAAAGGIGLTLVAEELSNWVLTVVPAGVIIPVGLALVLIRSLRRDDPIAVEAGKAGREVLPRPARLIGRAMERDQIVHDARNGLVVVVRGPAGTGTSTLAIAAAAQLAPNAKAQYYVDLRGQDWQRPENALSVARRVLRALGRPSGDVESAQAATEKVRAALRGKRRLLLLDNVARWEQISWLPDHVGDAWLIAAGEVAGCDQIILPAGFTVVPIRDLTPDEGIALLREQSTLGGVTERMDADPDATRALARSYLTRPAVVTGIGRWLAENPGMSIADLLAELHHEPHDQAQQVLGLLVRHVSPPATWLLARLVGMPVAEVGIDATTALTGLPRREAERLMAELRDNGLVEQVHTARWRVVDAARPTVPRPQNLDLARRRLIEYYAERSAANAERLPQPEARRWFEVEDKALLQVLGAGATQPWAARPLRRIADALDAWFALEHRVDDRGEAADRAARAAERLHDDIGLAVALVRRCVVALMLGEIGRAKARFNDLTSRLDADEAKWRPQQHLLQAMMKLALGDDFDAADAALTHYARALRGADLTGLGTVLIDKAVVKLRRGQLIAAQPGDQRDRERRALAAAEAYRDARELLISARGPAREAEDAHAEAHAAELLGLANWYLHSYGDAAENWSTAAMLYERCGDRTGRARCEVHQATALLNGGSRDPARTAEAAESLHAALGNLPATGLVTALAYLHLAIAEPAAAAGHRKAGLAALAPRNEPAEPAQVTEIRRRLEELPDHPGEAAAS